MLPVWLYASLSYTHDASVVICERHLIGNENHSHSAMLVSTHCHHGHTARHLNANENDSHSAIMGTQRAPHVSEYSLTYNHAGCVGIRQPSLTYRHEGFAFIPYPDLGTIPLSGRGAPTDHEFF